MAEAAPRVDMQFETPAQQREAVELGMWIFLLTEAMLFAGTFTAYFVYRFGYAGVFSAASDRLDLVLGTANTVVLLTSSLTMAVAVAAVEHGRRGLGRALALVTVLLGCVFLAVKGYEYAQEIAHGFAPFTGTPFAWDGPAPGRAEMFFNLYFGMTGLHALHLVSGIGILVTIAILLGREPDDGRAARRITMAGLYWHFVDVMWVFLFAFFYLL